MSGLKSMGIFVTLRLSIIACCLYHIMINNVIKISLCVYILITFFKIAQPFWLYLASVFQFT